MNIRLGILTTHPIQYQVPWFQALAKEPGIDLEVLYCMLPDAQQQGSGFGVQFQWDVPLLEGYRYRVLDNRAALPSVTTFSGCDTPGIRRIVRDERWDAFIVNGWVARSCLQLLAACRLHGVPCIVRGESNAIRQRAGWKRLIHRVLLRQYAACLTIGTQNRAFYLANGVPENRIFSTPYCVQNERFEYPGRQARTEGPFTFLFSGKLIHKKRPMDALQAMARLVDEVGRERVLLLIAGDGELRAECEAFVRQNRLPARFLGFLNQSRIVEAYRESDCLLLPSDNGETWGLVVNEAMASGLPVIVSDQVGCHPDLVVEGVTGCTYPCGSSTALADRMARLCKSPADAFRMGQAARERVQSGFSYAQVVQGTLQALRQVGAPGAATRPAGFVG
jgi:glycosyltransferase involved in cell wall biosynthesis